MVCIILLSVSLPGVSRCCLQDSLGKAEQRPVSQQCVRHHYMPEGRGERGLGQTLWFPVSSLGIQVPPVYLLEKKSEMGVYGPRFPSPDKMGKVDPERSGSSLIGSECRVLEGWEKR